MNNLKIFSLKDDMYIGLLGLPSQNTIDQKFTSHSSGGWKVQDQVLEGSFHFEASWLVGSHLLTMGSYNLFFVHKQRKREISGISSSFIRKPALSTGSWLHRHNLI